MRISDVLIQEGADEFWLRALIEVVGNALVLLHQPLVGLLEVGCERAVRDELLRFKLVVLGRLLQQHLLELLLVEFARVLAHLDQHLNAGPDLRLLDDLAVALLPNVLHEQPNQAVLDLLVLDHVVLELTVLHVLDQGQVELGHIVLIHVEEDIADHDNALLYLFPDPVEFAEELLVVSHFYVLGDWP